MDRTDKLFVIDKNNSVRFMGEKLEVLISKRYESHGCLSISDKITVLAIFDMVLDDKYSLGFYLPSIITTEPSENEVVSDEGTSIIKFTYYKEDVFIKNTELVKQSFIGYILFYEFVYLGVKPKFIDYEFSSSLFDNVKKICDVKIPANRVVFEMISSHLYRDADDVKVLYRHTDMKKPPVSIPLLDVSHAAISTTARIVGSYFNAAVDSSLVNASDANSRLEDLLRL